MKIRMIKMAGLVVLAALLITLLLPSAAFATLTGACRFYGPVTVDGDDVPAGTTVRATIEGVSGNWTAVVFPFNGRMFYALDIPEATASHTHGSLVHFSVIIGGIEIAVDPQPGDVCFAPPNNNVFRPINVTIPIEPDVVTTTLPVHTGLPYSATVMATGGTPPYHFSFSTAGGPGGLSLSDAGVITGAPLSRGTKTFMVVVTDQAGMQGSGIVTMEVAWMAGDANGDHVVNIADVTKAELIILGNNDPTPGADANMDGEINIADVSKIELIILGL